MAVSAESSYEDEVTTDRSCNCLVLQLFKVKTSVSYSWCYSCLKLTLVGVTVATGYYCYKLYLLGTKMARNYAFVITKQQHPWRRVRQLI